MISNSDISFCIQSVSAPWLTPCCDTISDLSHRSSGETAAFAARGESFRIKTPQVSLKGISTELYFAWSTGPNTMPKSISPLSNCYLNTCIGKCIWDNI